MSSLTPCSLGRQLFEYFGNGTHRCVPAQHLAAVSPVGLALVAAGSLPDLFLVVVERDCGLRVFVDKGELAVMWPLLGDCRGGRELRSEYLDVR